MMEENNLFKQWPLYLCVICCTFEIIMRKCIPSYSGDHVLHVVMNVNGFFAVTLILWLHGRCLCSIPCFLFHGDIP